VPHQNRVTPFGTLVAVTARGSLMGNRGRLHDDGGVIRRSYQGKRWIICLLEFKDRRRAVMTPGQYTELFFLDEATAFAAGHRPCAECQRDRFEMFRQAWIRAGLDTAGMARPSAVTIDNLLHRERVADGHKLTYSARLESLPNGTFISDESDAYLLFKNRLLRWSPTSYASASEHLLPEPVQVLTPRPLVAVLAAGYPIGIHSTAFELARASEDWAPGPFEAS